MYTFKHGTACGTFDHFHAGHEAFLEQAFEQAEKVSIGITTDKLLEGKNFKTHIQSFNDRKKYVEEFLKRKKLLDRAVFFELTDVIGIADEDESLDSIFITKDTIANARKVNQQRKKIGFRVLKIITVSFIKAQDNRKISSTRIRKGEIDRQGEKYAYFFKEKVLQLPSKIRYLLREPLGKIIEGTEETILETAQKAKKYIEEKQPSMLISVGDIATESLENAGAKIDFSIIDFKTQRNKEVTLSFTSEKKYKNNPGTISGRAIHIFSSKLKKFFSQKGKQQLLISGEEDLIALPAILLAPLGAMVVYGQFKLGLVIVEVTEEMKKQVLDIVKKFK